jgi:hypothetical protein
MGTDTGVGLILVQEKLPSGREGHGIVLFQKSQDFSQRVEGK